MGQDLRDCHNLWKRRISQKVVFVKLDAVGMGKRYRWTVHKAITGEKFQSIRSGVRKYDQKFFGIYASHESDTDNTDDFKDDRANVFKSPFFKYGIPSAVIVAFFAVNYLIGFFDSSPDEVVAPPVVQSKQATSTHSDKQTVVAAPPVKPEKQGDPEPIDYLDKISRDYRFRLSGLVKASDGRIFGRVEALDASMRLKERFRIVDIEALGWTVEYHAYGLLIYKKDGDRTVKHVVRPWPIDPFGRVSQAQQRRL